MEVVGIVPLKALDQAKGRLSPGLDAAARRDLAAWMLAHVVRACHDAAGVSRVVVVAGDRAGVALAREAGAETLLQPLAGLRAALDLADAELAGAAATLVVAADLPLIGPEDLDQVVAAAGAGRAVVVAPTSDGGTGALLRRPAGVIGTAYGPGSAAAHLALAQAAGVTAVRLDNPRLAMDIDTPEQLATWRAGFPAGLAGA